MTTIAFTGASGSIVFAGDAVRIDDSYRANWGSRAELSDAIAGGLVPVDGLTYYAEGLAYLGQSGATTIGDLPGLVPAGMWTPEHWGDTTVPNCTAVVDAASLAAATAGQPLWFEGRDYRGSFKARSGGVWFGVIGQTQLRVHVGAPGSANALYHNVTPGDGILTDFMASGFILNGMNESNVGECAFLTYGFQNIRFEDCIFTNGETYGFGAQSRPGSSRTENQDRLFMARCGFVDNGLGATEFDGLDVKYGTNMHFVDCWATGNGDSGFNIRGTAAISGLRSWGNGTDNILLQATDLAAGYPSHFQLSGVFSGETIAGPGLRIQSAGLNNTNVTGTIEATGATGANIEISGLGQTTGVLSVNAHDGLAEGVRIAGDYVGQLLIKGRIADNAGDGCRTAGKNCVVDAVITGNGGVGYREESGSDNNVLAITSIVSGNGTDMSARVGAQADDGWFSALTKLSMRAFPGHATSLDVEIDGAGAFAALRTTGAAASVGLRAITRGNGSFDVFHQNGVRQLFAAVSGSSSAVNYPRTVNAATGNPVLFQAAGSDANVGADFRSQGAGVAALVSGGGTRQVQVSNTGVGFFGTAPVAKPAGIAVSAAGIHAALVSLGLIAP